MKHIGKDDKILMQSIQESMFVFETLILSDDKSLQTLLRAGANFCINANDFDEL